MIRPKYFTKSNTLMAHFPLQAPLLSQLVRGDFPNAFSATQDLALNLHLYMAELNFS